MHSLHAISFCDRVKNEALKKTALQKTETMQVTGNTILISPLLDCIVRINHEPDDLLNADMSVISSVLALCPPVTLKKRS